MAAARCCFTPLSLPLPLPLPLLLAPPPPLKRPALLLRPLPLPSLISSPKQFRVSNAVHRHATRLMAADGSPGLGEEVVPRSVPVRVAHELLQAGHRYLDVRTVDEFISGHPVGATNIPYMFKAGSGMTKNPNFLDEVFSVFGKDDEIIIGCQSGRRSLMAATDLSSVGFTGITDIAGGYSAWVQNGLPIKQ